MLCGLEVKGCDCVSQLCVIWTAKTFKLLLCCMCRGWWGLLSVNITWSKLIIDLEKRFSEISTSTFCSCYLVTKFSCHQNMEVKEVWRNPIFNTAMYEHFIHGFTHLLPHTHSPPPPPSHPHTHTHTPTQWCTWCLGAEALLLPTNAAISRRPNWETSQLCSFGEITCALSLLLGHLLYSSLFSALIHWII